MTERISELLSLLRDEDNCNVLDCIDEAADLIESISAELEQVKRERDAAVEDFTEAMKHSESCIFCKHLNVIDDDGGCDMPKILPGESCWQWRGAKEVRDGT